MPIFPHEKGLLHNEQGSIAAYQDGVTHPSVRRTEGEALDRAKATEPRPSCAPYRDLGPAPGRQTS